MEVTTLYAVVVSLRLDPSWSQFFQYDNVTLSCEDQRTSSPWRVKRNTSIQTNQDCELSKGFGLSIGATCCIDHLYETDSGAYWCESAEGKRSDVVTITVTAGSLILESPAHPVDEGQSLTLYCRNKLPSINLTHFFRNELLIGSSSTGNLTITRVSKSDEGFYKCNASGAGESLSRWLAVRAHHHEEPSLRLTNILLPVTGGCLLLFVLMLLCLWRNHKGKVDRAVSYTDVTIAPEFKPQRLSDVGDVPTFYSRVKPETS